MQNWANQAESGTGLATSGTVSLPAGAGAGGDPDAASGGGEDEGGAAFSPDAAGVGSGGGAFASVATDLEGSAEGSATFGGSGKSQGRGINASGIILWTHMRICPSAAELA